MVSRSEPSALRATVLYNRWDGAKDADRFAALENRAFPLQMKPVEAMEGLVGKLAKTKSNAEFLANLTRFGR